MILDDMDLIDYAQAVALTYVEAYTVRWRRTQSINRYVFHHACPCHAMLVLRDNDNMIRAKMSFFAASLAARHITWRCPILSAAA